MICPVCQETLQMTDRQGVEIDYCPKCRGVWLDRGELQKLIDLSLAQLPQMVPATARQPTTPPMPPVVNDPLYAPTRPAQPTGDRYRREYDDDDRYPERHYESDYYRKKHKKRESWFSELFDFD